MTRKVKCLECEESCEVEEVKGQVTVGVICDDCSKVIFGDIEIELDKNGEPRVWTQKEIDEFNEEMNKGK